jgi:predicted DNA-binding protein
MKSPRVNVSLNPGDFEVLLILSEKKKMSMSSMVKKMVENWLEDYEDYLLSIRADEAELESDGHDTYTHEEVCQIFGIK